jgi:hypothetical protein
MTAIRAIFDGKAFIPQEPVALAPQAEVLVLIKGTAPIAPTGSSLKEIAALAKPGGLPGDFAEQHEHYTKGTPRR